MDRRNQGDREMIEDRFPGKVTIEITYCIE
jgi:hypothetical protein